MAQVSGRVVDKETGEPLPAAVVSWRNISSVTNNVGRFVLPVTPDSITVSFLGYRKYTASFHLGDSVIKLSPKYYRLSEFEIEIDPFHKKLRNTTGSYFLLQPQEINVSGENSPVSMLNSIPGVYVQQGTQNTNRVTIRGIGTRTPYSTNRIKVYLGEIPLTTADGISVIEDLDMSVISSIELLKGPSSAVYGSGLGGTIKLTPFSSVKGDEYFINSALSSFNQYYLSTGINKSLHNGGFSAQISRTSSEGYRENNSYLRDFFRSSGYFTTSKSRFDMQLLALKLNAEIPSSLNSDMFTNSPQKAAPNWLAVNGRESYYKFLAGLTFTRYINTQVTNKFSLSGGYANQSEIRPFNIMDDDNTFISVRENFLLKRDRVALNAGGEWYFEKYEVALFAIENGEKRERINRNFQHRQYANIFVHGEYKASTKLLIEAGLNLNYLQYKVFDTFASDSLDISGMYSFKPIISPRAGINYNLNSVVVFYASLGHGFSHPSTEETLMPEGSINTSIKPETGLNFEAGTRLNIWQGRLWTDISLYIIQLKNLLVTKRIDEATFYGINAGTTNHKGVEAFLKWQITQPENLNHNLVAGLSLTMGENSFSRFIDDGINYSGNKLPGIPAYMLYGNLQYTFKDKFDLLFTSYLTGKQFLNDSNSALFNGYSVSNLKFLYKTGFWQGLNANVYFAINNIFNEKYASMILVNAPSFGFAKPRYYYPAMPLNMQFGVNLRLKK